MTDLVEHAVATLRALPPEMRDELARVLLQLAGGERPIYQLTPEERADLEEADQDVARGEFATDQEVSALWSKPIQLKHEP